MTSDLFTPTDNNKAAPLAARMRPRILSEYLGQTHILGEGKALRRALEEGHVHSMIFWGPPGVGKTTLARLIATQVDADFIALSAVFSGVKDIRQAVGQAQDLSRRSARRTILFVDEVHRFNKAQQDAFLPYVEDGTLIFIGATTENPSFEVNNALLSRCRVYLLKVLAKEALTSLVQTVLSDTDRGLGDRHLRISEDALNQLVMAADGDARRALNLIEIAADLSEDGTEIDSETLAELLSQDSRRFDKGGDIFYDQISALHKSVRGSDPDAALYWLLRMLDGGCDPLYVARRVIRMASEDIGNADPRGLEIALNAWQTLERLGSPEGELTLAQAVLYLACAAKSNAVYNAFKSARADVSSLPSYPVPMHLRNAPTGMMKEMGFGAGYRYAHDEKETYVAGENYFPEEMASKQYYLPVERGLEIKIAEKLRHLRSLDREKSE